MIKNKEHHDHSVTYKTNSIIHITHRIRLEELTDFVFNSVGDRPLSGVLYDFGGAAGYWGDYLSQRHPQLIKKQVIFDLEHPENSTRKIWHEPTLSTEYIDYDLNKVNIDIELNKGSILLCSETLEHVADPLISLSGLHQLARSSKSILVISIPIEHGLVGLFKCIARFVLGRNRGKGLYHNISYLLWSFGLGSNRFRGTDSVAYGDHDGFDSKSLIREIDQRFNGNNFTCMFGKSTYYAVFDFREE